MFTDKDLQFPKLILVLIFHYSCVQTIDIFIFAISLGIGFHPPTTSYHCYMQTIIGTNDSAVTSFGHSHNGTSSSQSGCTGGNLKKTLFDLYFAQSTSFKLSSA
jgi:hypothetical protein